MSNDSSMGKANYTAERLARLKRLGLPASNRPHFAATSNQRAILRIVRQQMRRKHHLLERFKRTKASNNPNTVYGPEYVAKCRNCPGWVTVYFPDSKLEAEQQGISPKSKTFGKRAFLEVVWYHVAERGLTENCGHGVCYET